MDSIHRAMPSNLHQVRRVLRTARQHFTNFGDEDLASLLRDGVAMIGASTGHPWGVMILQFEQRPVTLPASAPSRAYLRGVALTAGRSPIRDVPLLAASMASELRSHAPLQAIVYADGWLVQPLQAAGFALVDRLQYLELTQLQSRMPVPPGTPPAPDVSLRPAAPDDLMALAQLDALAFPAVWHFGAQELMTLLLAGRVQLAMRADRLVGYSALSMRMDSPARRAAQLARLAVHPLVQGAGIGRLLLTDVIDYTRNNLADSLTLNTQSSNERSLALYRAFGFHNTGEMTPVLVYMFGAEIEDEIV